MAQGPGERSSDYFVLVPFYSNLGYLRETLQSVVAQTDPRWRMIVVDDSPDDVGIADLAASLGDDRISVVRNPTNLGVAGSFNRCFDLAVEHGAELAMILHADDLVEPTYVATVREVHAHAPDAVCVAVNASIIGEDGRPRRSVPDQVKHALWPRHLDRLEGEQGLRLLLRGQFFYCPAVSYRMSLVPPQAWNQRWTQVMDLELYGRLLLDGGRIALDRRRCFRYRRHDRSMTQLNSATLARTLEETAVCRLLAADASRLGWHRAAGAGRVRFSVRAQSLLRSAQLAFGGRWLLARAALALSFSRP